ncbi:MAG: hypothetical protein KAH12_00015 [Anaerolineales bacterium]|nr:hypothetical protein [Anaerolineales bacterium]
MMHVTYDRLDNARYGLWAITLITVMACVVITLLSLDTCRDSVKMTQRVIQYLTLTTPTIIPSGRALRNADNVNPAIDLRHSPHLPAIHFSPEDLVFGSLKPETGDIRLSD